MAQTARTFQASQSLFTLRQSSRALPVPTSLVLVGFLNGIAISIFLGQIGKLLGFSVESSGIVPRLLEVLGKITLTHGPTLMVGLGSFAVLFTCSRWLPRLPAALAVLVVGGAATAGLELDAQGVAVLGPVPAGLPQLRWPTVPLEDIASLAAAAAGLALVVFTSGTVDRTQLRGEGWLPDRRRPRVCRLRGLCPITGLCRNRRGLTHGSWRSYSSAAFIIDLFKSRRRP
jgi:hypothetical protein